MSTIREAEMQGGCFVDDFHDSLAYIFFERSA
jgi:hypothetical protein